MKYKIYASTLSILLSYGLVAMTDDTLKETDKMEILTKAIKDHDLAQVRASLLVQPLTNQQVNTLIDQACLAQASAAEQVKPAYSETKVNNLIIGGLCGIVASSLAYELVKGFNPFFKYYAGKMLGKKIVLKEKTKYLVEALMRGVLLAGSAKLAAYFLHKGLARDKAHTNLNKAGKILRLLQVRNLCSVKDLAAQEQAAALIS